MNTRVAVSLLIGVLAAGLVATAVAQDGTPNLGSAQIGQVDSRWFIETRYFDAGGTAYDEQDNRSFSIGFSSPVNADTEFDLMYSSSRTATDVGGLHITDREVLSPVLKHRINGLGSTALTVSVGADVAIDDFTGMVHSTAITENDFTPAARLALEWGGATRWQLAAQVAAWDNTFATGVPGYGTVAAVGGGIVWPISGRLTLMGDVMVPVNGDNFYDEATETVDAQPVWSAGAAWRWGGVRNTTLTVYATNAIGPTLANSIIVSPENSMGLGAALRCDF